MINKIVELNQKEIANVAGAGDVIFGFVSCVTLQVGLVGGFIGGIVITKIVDGHLYPPDYSRVKLTSFLPYICSAVGAFIGVVPGVVFYTIYKAHNEDREKKTFSKNKQ